MEATKHLLSKSTFLKGLQCTKNLYLYKHHYQIRDAIPVMRQAMFVQGMRIGELARKLFPGGVDASPSNPKRYGASVGKTQAFIESGEETIYEAVFQYEQVLCGMDLLVKTIGKWYAYEVKSSTRLSPVHIMDAALQYFVITNAGIELEDIFIVHVDNSYVRHGKIDTGRLFKKISVKKQVLKNQLMIREKIGEFKEVLSQQEMPDVNIGVQCYDPYACDFLGHCWKHIPEHSVFDIAGMGKKKQFELYERGILNMEEIPKDAELTNKQWVQVKSRKTGNPVIDKEEISAFLDSFSYPLYFTDFETIMPAIPIFDNTHPFQQLPFQYSLHFLKDRGEELQHFEFLAEQGSDPRASFIEHFLEDTSSPGDILVYNLSFEKMILTMLAKEFSEYSGAIEERISRMKDLMEPFRMKHYYLPEMKGSYSIKNVLPALVPDLGYDELEIGDGYNAMSSFEQLQFETDMFKILETRNALLEYCKMDTYAMVRILQVLEGVN